MYRVRTVFTGVAGSPWYSNLYFSDDSTRQASGAKSAVAGAWNYFKPQIPTSVTMTVQGEVYKINAASGVIEDVIGTTAETFVGTNATQASGFANQGLLTERTGVYRGGKPVIGKTFFPAVPQNAFNADGTLTSTYRTFCVNWGELLRTGQSGGLVLGWGVWSRPRTVFGVEIPGQLCGITSTSSRSLPAVLRTRRD